MPSTLGYSTATWVAPVTVASLAAQIPPPFSINWLDEESGGNPCTIGKAGQHGPDGAPRELGIAQLYNPDDLKLLSITSSELRAYCAADPDSQVVTRDLTEAEVTTQVRGLIGKIQQARASAMAWLHKVGATWPEIDTWKMTKLVHGLPGLVHGVVAVTAKLGRPPTDWSEFRAAIATTQLDAQTEAYRNNPPKRVNFSDIFDNAEHATRGMS